jgi:hypothetical protein
VNTCTALGIYREEGLTRATERGKEGGRVYEREAETPTSPEVKACLRPALHVMEVRIPTLAWPRDNALLEQRLVES